MPIVLWVVLLGVALLGLHYRHRQVQGKSAWEWEPLFGLLPVGIGFCDDKLSLRRANPAFRNMFAIADTHAATALCSAQWLDAGQTLVPLLQRALGGENEVVARIRLQNGESCWTRICRHAYANAVQLSVICHCGDLQAIEDASTPILSVASPSKDEQILRIAHDLSNPLNAMLGWLQLLEAKKIPDDEIDATLRRIQKDARRQVVLIDELRKLVRPAQAA